MQYCSQFVLPVTAGKWLIAEAVVEMSEVRDALKNGKIVLRGGTTVSCISEILLGHPLKISGRISLNGACPCKKTAKYNYSYLITENEELGIDEQIEKHVSTLRSGDVLITGANLIDRNNVAAILAGSLGGVKLY